MVEGVRLVVNMDLPTIAVAMRLSFMLVQPGMYPLNPKG